MSASLLGLFSGFPTHHFPDAVAQVLRAYLPRRKSLVFISAWPEEYARNDDVFYHYDTPLTVEHEMDILRQAGFRDVRIMKQWGESTYTVLANKD